MKQVTINVYELSELSEKSQNEAINNYLALFPFDGLIDDSDYYKSILHEYFLDVDFIDMITYDLDNNFINIRNSERSNKLLKNSLLSQLKYDGITNIETLGDIILEKIKEEYPQITMSFFYIVNLNFSNSRNLNFDIEYNYDNILEYLKEINLEYDLLSSLLCYTTDIFIIHIKKCLEKIRISLNNDYEYYCSFKNVNEVSLLNNWYYTIDGNFYNGDI